jgi:hypothetical protein
MAVVITLLMLHIQFSCSVAEVAIWNLRLCLVDWRTVLLFWWIRTHSVSWWFSFSFVYDFCRAPFYPMVLVPRVFCCFWLEYFSNSCVFVFGDSAANWSFCLSYIFLTAVAVYADLFPWSPNSRVMLLALAENFIYEFWYLAISYRCRSSFLESSPSCPQFPNP